MSQLETLDTSLIDMQDSFLLEIIARYAMASCVDNSQQSILGSICSAYVAGRLRGRKESMLKKMLGEGDEKD